MASGTNCLGYVLATTYWLRAFSSTMAGFIIIDLHDSRGTTQVLGRDGVLATVALLTSVLSLLHAGLHLSCLLTYSSVTTAKRSFPLLLVETLATTWTVVMFAVVTSLVMESSEPGDKCTTSGDGAISNCKPSGYERGCMAFATASALMHLLVLVVLCWTKATSSSDTEAMVTTPTPLSASKYAASLEKPEAIA